MKINNRYEIRVVVIELTNDGTGDVYDNFEDFKKEHFISSYRYGFVVFDTQYGCVPDECNDWNDSPEEALMDYKNNCDFEKVTRLSEEYGSIDLLTAAIMRNNNLSYKKASEVAERLNSSDYLFDRLIDDILGK